LDRTFGCVVGRYDGMDPREMKPSDHLVTMTMQGMNADPATTTLVGDSVTDIHAARAAGIRSIGYANKPGKRSALAAAGASTLIESMDELAAALLLTPVLPN
jgi:phosphoglycolate phosphatase